MVRADVDVDGGSLGQRWVLWVQFVLVDPVGEGFGEECVMGAGVVEVVGGVDEGGGVWGVSVGLRPRCRGRRGGVGR